LTSPLLRFERRQSVFRLPPSGFHSLRTSPPPFRLPTRTLPSSSIRIPRPGHPTGTTGAP